jgi:cyclopropane-fatty-acyl-phospholipid synthase
MPTAAWPQRPAQVSYPVAAAAFVAPARALQTKPARMLTAPLRRALASALPERAFELRFWDGTTVPATEPGAPLFELRSPTALAHMVRAPVRLGMFRAYVEGSLDFPDLDAAVDVIFANWDTPPPIAPAHGVRIAAAALVAAVGTGFPRKPALEVVMDGEPHTVARDKSAVRYHYNAGNEFFSLFLDPTMTYTCALFRDGATTLEEAQAAKLDLVARKLGLTPGMRVLDVGCGWGAFSIHAAREYGTSVLGITLSEPQAALARELAEQAGVGDRVEIRVADYRELREQPFDAIAAIGCIEHIGERRVDEYAGILASLLAPGARLLNHGIAALRVGTDIYEDEGSHRFVFPDGELLFPSRVQMALERAGLLTEHSESFRLDYAVTLAHWAQRFDEHLDHAERVVGSERTRIWRMYLRVSRNLFEHDYAAVHQFLARRLA